MLVCFTMLHCPQVTSGWWGHCCECFSKSKEWGQTLPCAAVVSRQASRLVPRSCVRAGTKVKSTTAFLLRSTGQTVLWGQMNGGNAVSKAVLCRTSKAKQWAKLFLCRTSICNRMWDLIMKKKKKKEGSNQLLIAGLNVGLGNCCSYTASVLKSSDLKHY